MIASGWDMVRTQRTIQRTLLKLSLAAVASVSLGAAVVAGPMVWGKAVSTEALPAVTSPVLVPLASGPAIQLAKAGPGEREDCVRITRLTGPDGREYPTNGIVCGER